MRRTTPFTWLVLFAALVTLSVAPALAATRGWLGVYTQEVTAELRDALDLSSDGALVTNVVAGSPAERAGLRKGDVITSVDRRTVDSPAELSERIGESSPGESVSLEVNRKGDHLTLAVRLGERPQADDDDDLAPTPAPAPMAPRAPKAPRAPRAPTEMRWHSSEDGDVAPDAIREHLREIVPDLDLEHVGPGKHMVFMSGAGRGRLGVRVETLGEDLAAALGATGTRGVLVVEVLEGTPAQSAGLRAGDIITAVEGAAVSDGDDLIRALRNENGRVSLSVVRRGAQRTVEAELQDASRVIRLRDRVIDRKLGSLGDEKKIQIRLKGDEQDGDDLREQIRELREQLRELREELQERRR